MPAQTNKRRRPAPVVNTLETRAVTITLPRWYAEWLLQTDLDAAQNLVRQAAAFARSGSGRLTPAQQEESDADARLMCGQIDAMRAEIAAGFGLDAAEMRERGQHGGLTADEFRRAVRVKLAADPR